jgi:ABC-2 type transport system permease protein
MTPFIQLIKKEIYRFMSIWIQTIVGPVSTAILYQLIFGQQFALINTATAASYSAFLIPGLVMMQVLLNAFGNGSSSLIQSKYTGNIIFILMSPITPFTMYSAYLISSILRGVLVGVAVFLGIFWFGASLPQAPFLLIYFLIFGAAITAGLGLIAGIICDKFDQLSGFQSFIITPLIYLAGVFFNPVTLPGVWNKVALVDPFLYIVDGFRYGFIMHQTVNLAFGATFVFISAVLINFIGYILLKKGIRIKY